MKRRRFDEKHLIDLILEYDYCMDPNSSHRARRKIVEYCKQAVMDGVREFGDKLRNGILKSFGLIEVNKIEDADLILKERRLLIKQIDDLLKKFEEGER